MKLQERLLNYRMWVFMGGFAFLQALLSLRGFFSESREERLKLELSSQD